MTLGVVFTNPSVATQAQLEGATSNLTLIIPNKTTTTKSPPNCKLIQVSDVSSVHGTPAVHGWWTERNGIVSNIPSNM
jgi:hypothetical protein